MKRIELVRVIAYLLLAPPVFSVLAFCTQLAGIHLLRQFNTPIWSGQAMSALPVYLGLMAIAGAILLKKS